jgi:hypothetical protein
MPGPIEPPRILQGHFPAGRPSFRATGPATAAGTRGHATIVPPSAGLQFTAGGHPLPPAVQQRMESAFGTSFAQVRVHVGAQATAIGADAFTSGQNIYFAPGRYEPHSPRGMKLLAHELSHVVQQKSGRVHNPFAAGVALVRDPRLEAEAEQMSARALAATAAQAPAHARPHTHPHPHPAQPKAAPLTAHQVHAARLSAIAQMKRGPVARGRVAQRNGLQDLSIYELSDRMAQGIREAQRVLANPAAVEHWMNWLTLQTDEIFQRLTLLDDQSDSWISSFSDASRREQGGSALRRWKAKKQKALDLALWRIECRWVTGLPTRQTLFAERGTNASAFSEAASSGNALKDVGAPLTHGEYPHRIQWYVIYRHLTAIGFSAAEIRDVYLEMVDKKHIRVLENGTLRAPNSDQERASDNARSLWDRVVDIRLSERNTGVQNAYWGSPLAVTHSLRLDVEPPKSAPPNLIRFGGSVAAAVTDRLNKRRDQRTNQQRYFGANHPDAEQLNLAREITNRYLSETLNLG